jgi:hypothetical protein
MKKSLILSTIVISMGSFHLYAQDTLSNGKALNFPTRKYGISIGNSYEFTGIRINFADENVKVINGLNVTFWLKRAKNQNAVVNGISVGVIPTGGTMQPINIGLLALGSANGLNGLSIGGTVVGSGGNINGLATGGIVVGSSGNINGLCVSGLGTMADGENSVISGIAVSGICVGAHKAINGLAIGGLVVSNGDINGVATGLAYISAGEVFRGLAVTAGYLKSDMFKGIAIASYARTNQMNGLSIALYNRTKELHGVQFGLLNYAENNPKGLRILPFINLHL